jgi:hypothetical protein
MGSRVSSIVAFLRADYPRGAPAVGYVPLFALLPRRMSEDEITAIATKLSGHKHRSVDSVDVGMEITRVIDEMPSGTDIERVQRRLRAMR